MKRRPRLAGFFLTLVWCALSGLPATVLGHGRPPVVLHLVETHPDRFAMSLHSPVESADPVPLQPRFPSHCRVLASELDCRGTPSTGQGLRGGLLAVEMADSSDDQRTLELIYVITWLDGEHESGLLRPLPGEDRCQLAPRQPAALLPGSTWTTSLRYLRLGVEHILAPLAGADHLLFVLGLILLVGDLRTLLWCITAFTLGHSLTLAAATLDLLRLSGPPVEILIALSIVFLARELAQSVTFPADLANPKARRSHGGSAALLALSFGLLHGLGFASALADAGLPTGQRALALLSFNAGVEVGQLIWVIAWLPLWRLYRRYAASPERGWLRLGPAYVLGSLAAALTLSRLFDVLSWPG